ncbi:hypothetical protein RR42_s2813 [Cupriavidus basilensis]|uniref:Uncharacterized protein n=1 Tax=Cupriavidus basilensis TaxID=68895 RepID=A0A0C4YQW0_9BURK|nr:hypothetical protein RR42_s2813 [Cupriavidus basilensis]
MDCREEPAADAAELAGNTGRPQRSVLRLAGWQRNVLPGLARGSIWHVGHIRIRIRIRIRISAPTCRRPQLTSP